MFIRAVKYLTAIILAAVIIFPTQARAELTEADIVLIRDVIAKYEAAYSRKDLPAMIDCCDKNSEWFKGLESEISQEFRRFKYLRVSSTDKRMTIEPGSDATGDVACMRHAFYVAYLDSQASGPDANPRDAVINEFDAVYFVAKPKDGGPWKIRAWGQTESPEQAEYIKAKDLMAQGKVEEARKSLERAIEIDPDYSAAYSALADLSIATGKIDDSIRNSEKAISLRPEEAYYRYSLGMIYLLSKNKEKAFDALSTARYLDPEFPDIDYYIDNIDKVMARADSLVRAGVKNEAIAKAMSMDRSVSGDSIAMKDLNIMIKKPRGWNFIPSSDWRVLAAMSPVPAPNSTDTLATISVKPFGDDEKPRDANTKAAEDMAAKLGKKTIIRLGETKVIDLAGLKAAEDLFVFVIDNVQMLVFAATLEKKGMAYTLVYSARARKFDDLRIDTRPYKEIISDFVFIDPKSDMKKDVRKLLEDAAKTAQTK
jgi:tetratricopeptide (TPR) repeat protein